MRGDGDGPRPVVMMGSGLGGLFADVRERHARAFTARGITVLGFDCRYSGEGSGRPRRLIDIRRQRRDWRAAIRFAQTQRDGVDHDRVALRGTSMAGGHVLSLAADHPELRAVVAQAPRLRSGAAPIPARKTLGIARLVTLDLAREALGGPPVNVRFVGGPGEIAPLTEPGALEHDELLAREGRPRGNATPARSALGPTTYSPVHRAHLSRVPTSISVATQDGIAPATQARWVARSIGAELHEVDTGHFGVSRGAPFARLSTAQADFLEAQLEAG